MTQLPGSGLPGLLPPGLGQPLQSLLCGRPHLCCRLRSCKASQLLAERHSLFWLCQNISFP